MHTNARRQSDAVQRSRKGQNVSPQASPTPSAKTRLAMRRQERQPTKRCQTFVSHEERKRARRAPPDMSESRRARRQRGAQPGQKRRISALGRGVIQQKDGTAKFKSVGTAARKPDDRETRGSMTTQQRLTTQRITPWRRPHSGVGDHWRTAVAKYPTNREASDDL